MRIMEFFHRLNFLQRHIFAVAAFLVSLILSQPLFGQDNQPLTIYTYDSFVSEYGAGPKLAQLYKQQKSQDVRFVSKGDGGQLLNAAILEGKNIKADIILGMDNFLLSKAEKSGLFLAYQAQPQQNTIPWARSANFTAYDYGWLAIVWDTKMLKTAPKSLKELTDSQYKKKIILIDPRSSTPGLGFLAWTEVAFGSDWKIFWRALGPNVLSMPPSWDQAYGLFASGEAPLVLSYGTDAAYQKQNGDSERYRVLVFPEGQPVQIEYAGISKYSARVEKAKAFLDFLVSKEAQEILPTTQWMYPVNPEASVPASFSAIPSPAKKITSFTKDYAADATAAVDQITSTR